MTQRPLRSMQTAKSSKLTPVCCVSLRKTERSHRRIKARLIEEYPEFDKLIAVDESDE